MNHHERQADFRLVDAASVAPQAWRNGGGQTRELIAWPAGADWRVRISRADIERDGPFSAFPRVERWFAVLHGDGVVLTFSDASHELKSGDDPLCFDGAVAPGCRLLNGATQDLNLMVRQGKGVMHTAQAGQDWIAPFAARGIYTTVAGLWGDGKRTHAVAAQTLLWMQNAGSDAWSFAPDKPSAKPVAWWLGFTPDDDKTLIVRPDGNNL